MHGEWQVGLLEKRPSSLRRNEATWFWTLNGVPSPVPTGLCLAGFAGTVDEAKAELKKSWEQWLAWANLSPPTPKDAMAEPKTDEAWQREAGKPTSSSGSP
jgi:hypothetical protein